MLDGPTLDCSTTKIRSPLDQDKKMRLKVIKGDTVSGHRCEQYENLVNWFGSCLGALPEVRGDGISRLPLKNPQGVYLKRLTYDEESVT
jgi:hypothetical protein